MGFVEGAIIVSVSLLVGLGVGIFLIKKTNIINFVSKSQREKQKILNDPELLLAKLQEHGDIVDDGKKVDMSIVEINGKKQLKITIEESAVSKEELAKAELIEKEKAAKILSEAKEDNKEEVIESTPEEEKVSLQAPVDELDDDELYDEPEYSDDEFVDEEVEDVLEQVPKPKVSNKKKKKKGKNK